MISNFLVRKYAASTDSSGYSASPAAGLSCLKCIVIAAFWKTVLETDGSGASSQDCVCSQHMPVGDAKMNDSLNFK